MVLMAYTMCKPGPNRCQTEITSNVSASRSRATVVRRRLAELLSDVASRLLELANRLDPETVQLVEELADLAEPVASVLVTVCQAAATPGTRAGMSPFVKPARTVIRGGRVDIPR